MNDNYLYIHSIYTQQQAIKQMKINYLKTNAIIISLKKHLEKQKKC